MSRGWARRSKPWQAMGTTSVWVPASKEANEFKDFRSMADLSENPIQVRTSSLGLPCMTR